MLFEHLATTGDADHAAHTAHAAHAAVIEVAVHTAAALRPQPAPPQLC